MQQFNVTAAHVACTGPYVDAGTMTSVSLRNARKVNCDDLRLGHDGAGVKPVFFGNIKLRWTAPAGMGRSTVGVQAYVNSTVGQDTTFKYTGTVQQNGTDVFSGRHLSGTIKVHNAGLNSAANGGNCTATIPIAGGTIIASSFKLT